MKHDLAWNRDKPYVQSYRPLSILWHTLLAAVSCQILFHLTSLPLYSNGVKCAKSRNFSDVLSKTLGSLLCWITSVLHCMEFTGADYIISRCFWIIREIVQVGISRKSWHMTSLCRPARSFYTCCADFACTIDMDFGNPCSLHELSCHAGYAYVGFAQPL